MSTSASLRAANPPPLAGYDLFSEDRALVEALRREGGAAREEECAAFGRLCEGDALELGRLANAHPPLLRAYDRFGERIDEVEITLPGTTSCGSASSTARTRPAGSTSVRLVTSSGR
jgi:hypothetical protein